MSFNDPQEPVTAPVTVVPATTAPQQEPIPEALAAEGVPSRFACFVTGTDTEIGKTLVSSAMLHKLVQAGQRACGMKPIAAGAVMREGVLHNEDADLLAAAGNVHLPQHITTPFMLREPAAPHVAAALEGKTIDPVTILTAYAEILAASDATVVEGVGGFRVPLTDSFDTADLAVQFNLPVILVVGLRLGCISHALLTAEAIIKRGLVLAGWVANEVDPAMSFIDENIEAMAQRIPAPLLGRVPRLLHPSAAAAAEFINLSGVPGWPPAGSR
ncbi:dethiobiotin synthase [Massilia solisilvae]|uniref:ATP-dependent dethiobiotin synthetase BioD n=1 Tax=Massilia solisilvae TaxID=1811225 RepID=A0ABT2BNT6_9BURK|nr:dethiobiotin synthase [Massilia solisilvae]MCS0610154.1 dethiobiotin synthase [Massilia solisilvae]